ncbi:MAG TPA: GMC family oxidoreductase [Polyangiaceae bacterium]|jgi:choline dehydrogenase-like flavoprotein
MTTVDAADFVVVGSGAAGATAALVLAEAGRDVVVVEEGPAVRDEDRGLGSHEAFMRLFRDRATQVAMGRSVIPILQGRCVGGTTVVNGAIVWRLPEDAYDRAFGAIGAGDVIRLGDLGERMDRIERDLSVAPAPERLLGGNGLTMKRGAEKLGWKAHAIRRNVLDCQGSGRCLEACPTRRKQSMERTYLPRAEALGARVLADHEVRVVETSGARTTAVSGRRGDGSPFRIAARRGVLLAASAIQTPCILRRSGLGPRQHVGSHFRAHPGTAVAGIYRDPVRIWEGATQSYEVDEFRGQGFKMEVVGLPPELAGVRMPGLGEGFQSSMRDFPNMAVWGVQVRCEAEGTVSPAGDRSHITFTPTVGDMEIFRKGVRRLCELHFAAGAVRVYPGVHGGPEVLHSPDELAQLDALPLDPRDWSFIAAHLFSTCRMAATPDDGVVGFDGAVHGVRGLWVVDASALPTNLGVNPQHTIMALAMLLTERIAGDAPRQAR